MTDAPQAPERPPLEEMASEPRFRTFSRLVPETVAYTLWLEKENRRLREQLGEDRLSLPLSSPLIVWVPHPGGGRTIDWDATRKAVEESDA